jgi:lipopolysaccharide assembly protein A
MQKNQFMFIVSLVFAIIVTIFALTNANPVVINLFFYKFVASQALIILISAALGAVLVISLGLVKHIKLSSQIKTLRKTNEELSAEIKNLSDELNTIKIQNDETETIKVDNAIESENDDRG